MLLGVVFESIINEKRIRVEEINLFIQNNWSKELMKEYRNILSFINRYEGVLCVYNDLKFFHSYYMDNMNDIDAKIEFESIYNIFENMFNEFELFILLSGENDNQDAIVSINAGSGGLEAEDWAGMLFRMYLKWATKHDYTIEEINTNFGIGDGINSIDFIIKGKYSYGYLKNESGVHRLIRHSPFDKNKSRHTSFASVFIRPDNVVEEFIDIKPSDVDIQTFISTGAGGQHRNKVETAIRMKHLESGIVVISQSERSQNSNREMAYKTLKLRLMELEKQKNKEKNKQEYDDQNSITWGSQIRSYFLQPYYLINDHRSKLTSTNAPDVLDGNIDDFIKANLLSTIK